ncbi:MAG: putative sulfate exporter family transporter [Nitrospirae bacterium]|nr:putative sulfate exporter family transporter [Nitrospirota bacterium]
MNKNDFHKQLKDIRPGLLLAVLIGLAGYGLTSIIKSSLLDPLIIALILGIAVKSSLRESKKFESGVVLASSIFLPAGIIFYGLQNLNFAKLTEVDPTILLLMLVVMSVYFAVILLMGKLLGQKKQITYLTASGSAICGASAIAVTSPAVDAEPDDVSISLLSVTIAAFVGFALFLPFLASLFNLTSRNYCFLTGTTLQFTGLVAVAAQYTPFLKNDMPVTEMLSLALSVKAVRYLALLVAVPLFSSLIKKKLSVPWFLWAFIAAGLLGTWIYSAHGSASHSVLARYIKPVHTISWSIAMSAIGLNAEVKELLSNNGSKSLIMAFGGFIAATITFFAGLYIINYI